MKITIVGSGYVGLSLATLLAQNHEVTALDVIQEKVDMINARKSPIVEEVIEDFFANKKLNLTATLDKKEAYSSAELVIVATPTNYDPVKQYFDTSSIDGVVENVIKYNKHVPIVVKSTVPVGFTESMRAKYNIDNIYFSPEFLREGKSLYDNLHPSRIVVGDKGKVGQMFANLLKSESLDEDTPVLLTNPTEAEAIKLFANSYLATRVAYFNELDTYAMVNGLEAADIIKGISLDPRIGEGYNNPSFGFGGYCLPKDTKQLDSNFKNSKISAPLVRNLTASNMARKEAIVKELTNKDANVIGIYRLVMKANSDNFRECAIKDIMIMLATKGYEVIVYEPAHKGDVVEFGDYKFEKITDFDTFAKKSDIIVSNRLEDILEQYKDKVFTRDIYHDN